VALVRQLMQQELERIRRERGTAHFEDGHFAEAAHLFDELVTSESLQEFLTLKAYDLLNEPAEEQAPPVSDEFGVESKTVPFRRLADEPQEQLKKVA
jgi:uncharacterized membrane-anchored protein YhcB (DUF1043 family)